jgi:hypothetical protein
LREVFNKVACNLMDTDTDTKTHLVYVTSNEAPKTDPESILT